MWAALHLISDRELYRSLTVRLSAGEHQAGQGQGTRLIKRECSVLMRPT